MNLDTIFAFFIGVACSLVFAFYMTNRYESPADRLITLSMEFARQAGVWQEYVAFMEKETRNMKNGWKPEKWK